MVGSSKGAPSLSSHYSRFVCQSRSGSASAQAASIICPGCDTMNEGRDIRQCQVCGCALVDDEPAR
jgi:hypothetical protein